MDCTLTEPSETLANAEVAASGIRIVMLPSRPLHWRSLVLSVFTHALALSLLLSVRLPHRRNQMIDFETSMITYYKISPTFPNVAPKLQSESKPEPQSSDLQASQEIRIRPRDSSEGQIVIEQPNVRQISALPKLQLPNILMQTSRLDPGHEPMVVPSDVLRHLATDVQEPQSLQDLSLASTQTLAARQPALPLPQLAAPAAPAPEALQVNQIAGQGTQLQQRMGPAPYAAPPVEDFPAGFQVENVTAQGPNLLVFSNSPKFPEGSIAVPKISWNGRWTGSSTPSTRVVLAQDAAELSRAEVAIPSVSISNKTAPDAIGVGTAVVQAPLPAVPLEPKPSNPPRSSSLLDLLPSRIPSSKPLTTTNREIGSGESPLRDYENRGGPVYTAAINAPNFTSKRGSWIFRFAELSISGAASSPGTPLVSLTAPSAVVKVDPKYAPDLVREKLEGVVILFAILRKDGTIDAESVRVIRKLDNRLDVSARDALLSWRFRPSQRNGIPVDIQMEVSIPFYFRKEGL